MKIPSIAQPPRTPKPPAATVTMLCLECSHKFRVKATTPIAPICPRCGGADVDVYEPPVVGEAVR